MGSFNIDTHREQPTSFISEHIQTPNLYSNNITNLPRISSECGVVQRVEPIVVGDHDVGVAVQQEAEHVVPLLGDCIVQRSVAFGVLKRKLID